MKLIKLLSPSLLILFSVACSPSIQESNNTSQKLNSSSQTSETAIATVVDLTQVGCQFLETEAKDHHYKPKSPEECKKINSDTLASRKSEFKSLALKPGKYIFRVTNSNVPYELGFWLRGEGIKKISLPKVSGGGLALGSSQDYEVDLTPGKYVISCPLNPTPDYPIVVN